MLPARRSQVVEPDQREKGKGVRKRQRENERVRESRVEVAQPPKGALDNMEASPGTSRKRKGSFLERTAKDRQRRMRRRVAPVEEWKDFAPLSRSG